MAYRFGMTDGRCFTIATSDRLLNDYIMKNNGIQYQDNYAYRRFLQAQGPDVIRNIQNTQQPVNTQQRPNNYGNQCQTCNIPLLKVPNTY